MCIKRSLKQNKDDLFRLSVKAIEYNIAIVASDLAKAVLADNFLVNLTLIGGLLADILQLSRIFNPLETFINTSYH